MKLICCLLGCLLLLGCASQKPGMDEAAIEDFVSVRNLEPVDVIHAQGTASANRTEQLTDHHLRFDVYQNHYLIVFSRRCPDAFRGVPADIRNNSEIRAGLDSLRGCQIDRIYQMSREDLGELQGLGRAPGST